MNIAGAALYCIGQDQVHELYDGRFIGRFFKLVEVHFLLVGLQFDIGVVHVRNRLHHLVKVVFLTCAVRFLDAVQNRAFRRYYRLDIEAGHELDIVHGEHVRRINHRDRERRAHAAQGQNLVALCGLVRNQLDDGRINFKIRKIDCGHAILAGKKIGDILIGEEVELDECAAQATTGFALNFARLLQLLWGDDLLFDEKVSQPLGHFQNSILLKTWVRDIRPGAEVWLVWGE